MIQYIKNWWKGEHCCVKNPFFWLLVAGAGAAAPFTALFSLSAIPVLVILAERGELSYTTWASRFNYGAFMKKGYQPPPEEDLTTDEKNTAVEKETSEKKNVASSGIQSEKTTSDFIPPENLSPVVPKKSSSHEEITQIEEEVNVPYEESLSEKATPNPWEKLAEEALFTLEWLYQHRQVLSLSAEDQKIITTLLAEIPEKQRPSHYEKNVLSSFVVCQTGGISLQEDDHTLKQRLEESSGRKVGARLLLRFADDHTSLSRQAPLPCKTSRNITLSQSLQSVCHTLHQMLIRVFVQKATPTEQAEEQHQHSYWRVGPDFFEQIQKIREGLDRYEKSLDSYEKSLDKYGNTLDKYCNTLDKYCNTLDKYCNTLDKYGNTLDRLANLYEEGIKKRKVWTQEYEKATKALETDIERNKQLIIESERNIAVLEEENKQNHLRDLDFTQKTILRDIQDNTDFTKTRSRMHKKIPGSSNYYIEPSFIKELMEREENRLSPETADSLIIAIIKNHKQLPRRCLYHPENNPNGFITPEKVNSLIEQNKLPSTVLEKLGLAPKKNTSWFPSVSLISAFTKTNIAQKDASKACSNETKLEELPEQARTSSPSQF